MKFRRLLLAHAAALGLGTANQALAISKFISRDDPTGDFNASGRGPAAGPDATPYNAAKLVLAALAGGAQTRLPSTVPALFMTRPAGTDSGVASIVGDDTAEKEHPTAVCPITHAPCFGDAVKAILASSATAESVDRIEVMQGASCGSICFRDGRVARFVDNHTARRL